MHIDGYIADGAITLAYDEKHENLVNASELALKKALALLEKEPSFAELGKTIEESIQRMGFKVVRNLTGHGLERYIQHAPPSIPNVASDDKRTFENNKAYAIEPFATTGTGHVRESGKANIFALDEPKPVRNPHARKILSFVMENYKTLPFAERWLVKELKLSEFQLKVGLRSLLREKCIKAYPILHDQPGSFVSQAENSFIKAERKIILLVKPCAEQHKS